MSPSDTTSVLGRSQQHIRNRIGLTPHKLGIRNLHGLVCNKRALGLRHWFGMFDTLGAMRELGTTERALVACIRSTTVTMTAVRGGSMFYRICAFNCDKQTAVTFRIFRLLRLFRLWPRVVTRGDPSE